MFLKCQYIIINVDNHNKNYIKKKIQKIKETIIMKENLKTEIKKKETMKIKPYVLKD